MKHHRFLAILVSSVVIMSIIAGCGPVKLPSGPDAVWDLVVIGDSSLWELGDAYAAQIEKDQGVKVVFHDFTLGGLSAGAVLDALDTGKATNAKLEQLPEALKNAEVVVMFVNPEDSVELPSGVGFDSCFESKHPGSDNCLLGDLEPYIADLKGIWQHVIDLREGQETILYATNLYNPLVDSWQANGAFTECTTCWENLSAANRQAAEAYGIPFLDRLDVYNGADRTEDPKLKGYIRDDGEHPTQLAGEATAQALSDMGYEPVIP